MLHIRRVFALLLLLVAVLGSPSWAASTCTVTATTIDGVRHFRAVIAETNARDTTEVACLGLPVFGTILSYEATLSAGTGTTINTIFGRAASFSASTQDHIATADTTAAHIHEQGAGTVYYSPTGAIYVKNRPNSTATDHTIAAEMLVVDGAE